MIFRSYTIEDVGPATRDVNSTNGDFADDDDTVGIYNDGNDDDNDDHYDDYRVDPYPRDGSRGSGNDPLADQTQPLTGSKGNTTHPNGSTGKQPAIVSAAAHSSGDISTNQDGTTRAVDPDLVRGGTNEMRHPLVHATNTAAEEDLGADLQHAPRTQSSGLNNAVANKPLPANPVFVQENEETDVAILAFAVCVLACAVILMTMGVMYYRRKHHRVSTSAVISMDMNPQYFASQVMVNPMHFPNSRKKYDTDPHACRTPNAYTETLILNSSRIMSGAAATPRPHSMRLPGQADMPNSNAFYSDVRI